MTATYVPGEGMLITVTGAAEGTSIVLPEHMTIQAIQRHLRELLEFLG